MYLRKLRRKSRAGQSRDFWRWVESYRTERGTRQLMLIDVVLTRRAAET